MSTKTAIFTPCACQVGNVSITMHGMVDASSPADVALHFQTAVCGLGASFHGTSAEMRAFATELVRHCDATDAAAQPQQATA